jgi:hypothetical protein
MIQVFNQYVSVKSLFLMVVEAVLIVLSSICAVKVRFWNNPTEVLFCLALPDFAVQAAIVVSVCLACFYYNDLYDLSAGYGAVERVLRVEQSLGAASLLLGLEYFLFPSLLLGRGVFIIGMVLVTALVILSRRLLDRAWQLTAPVHRVVILGTGQLALELARELARELTRRGDLSMKLEGFVGGSRDENEKIFGFPAVRLDSKGPIIYRQLRVGRMGRCFEVLKFRSMRIDAETENGAQWASENDPRVTRVGFFLRKFRLDELPQFLQRDPRGNELCGAAPGAAVFCGRAAQDDSVLRRTALRASRHHGVGASAVPIRIHESRTLSASWSTNCSI